MEQDIEILERMLKIEKECLHYDVSQDEIRAIEHLIKAYKELNDIIKTANIAIKDLQQKLGNSIPVSLVEETKNELHNNYINSNGDNFLKLEHQLEILDKLLEKRK